MDVKALLTDPTFWLVITAIGLVMSLGWFSLGRKTRGSKVGKLFTGKNLLIVGLVMFLMFSGTLSLLSIAPTTSQSVVITDLQVTTGPDTHADVLATASTIAESTSVPDMIEIRTNTTGASETANHLEMNGTVITVTRSGAGGLPASGCDVRCIIPPDFEDQSAPDGTVYPILEKTALGEYECYVHGASSSTVATTSSQKEITSIPFAEGVSTGYLGIALEVDTGGFGALDDNGWKDVGIDVCGKVYTVRVIRED